MTETELAYLAGILDGEGHLAFFNQGRNRGRRRPEMQVDSVDPELIEWLRETVGGWCPSVRPARENRQAVHRWRIGGHAAGRLALRVAPYMQIHRKREMAESMVGW